MLTHSVCHKTRFYSSNLIVCAYKQCVFCILKEYRKQDEVKPQPSGTFPFSARSPVEIVYHPVANGAAALVFDETV